MEAKGGQLALTGTGYIRIGSMQNIFRHRGKTERECDRERENRK